MTAAEIVSELRSARPAAGDELRERIRALATREPPPRPSLVGRLRPRRALLVALPAAAAVTLAVAGAIGVVRSGDTRETAPAPATTEFAQSGAAEDAAKKGAATAPGAYTAPPGAGSVVPTPPADRAQRVSASLALEVADTDALSDATQRALSITRSLGGHVVSVSYASAETGTASLTLRVPTARTQEAVVRLSALGTIRGQQVQIDDLQEGLDAVERRIAALQRRVATLTARLADSELDAATRATLAARLDAARAELREARELHRVTAAEADYATVYLSLQTPDGAGVAPVPSRLDRALDEAAGVLAWEGIVLLYALIVAAPVLLAGFALWLVRRVLRRREEERLLSSA
jgi:hypothetical protein